EYMLAKDIKITVAFPWSNHTMKNANFQFIKKRKVAYLVSLIAIVISIGAILTKGFSYGVDFQGGRTYTVLFENKVVPEEIRNNLDEIYGTTTEVKTFGNENQLKITTSYHIEETSD